MPPPPPICQSDDLLQRLLPFTPTLTLRPAPQAPESPLISHWSDMEASSCDPYLDLPENVPDSSAFAPMPLAAPSPLSQPPALSEITQHSLHSQSPSLRLHTPVKRSGWDLTYHPSVEADVAAADPLVSFPFADLAVLVTEPMSEHASEVEADLVCASPSASPTPPAKRVRTSYSHSLAPASAPVPSPTPVPEPTPSTTPSAAPAPDAVSTAASVANAPRALTDEEKRADRRRRNREASSRSYYRRKQRTQGAAAALQHARERLTKLRARERALRQENAELRERVTKCAAPIVGTL